MRKDKESGNIIKMHPLSSYYFFANSSNVLPSKLQIAVL